MSVNKLTYIFFSASLFLVFTTSCNASSKLLTALAINDTKLELSDNQGKCALKYNKKLYLLNLPYPCGFIRTSNEMIAQKYHYKGIGTVFVIAGTPAEKDTYNSDDGVKPEHMCSNQGQAIIVNKNSLTLRKARTIKLGFCHQLGFDEKDFYGYAYPVE